MKVEEILNEGPLDYLKGMGQHVGGKFVDKMAEKGRQIAQPFVNAHRAGQQASQQGDVRSLTNRQQQLIRQLAQLAEPIGPDVIVKLINTTMGAKVNLASAIKKQFLLAAQPQQSTNEGLFDYMRGASRAAGGATQNARQGIKNAAGQAGQSIRGAARQIGDATMGAAGQVKRSAQQAGQSAMGAAREIHQQGQQASVAANSQRRIEKATQLIIQIGQIMLKINSIKQGKTSRYS